MNLLFFLQNGYSKQQSDEVVAWVGNNQSRFNELLNVFLHSTDYKIVQRAAWSLSYAAVNYPVLIHFHYQKLIQELNAEGKPAAVRRNILRIFDQIPQIPESYHGIIMDVCFKCIANPQEAIATQAFALGILHKLSKIYPEILHELKTTIAVLLPNAAPAFKSRAKKILKE